MTINYRKSIDEAVQEFADHDPDYAKSYPYKYGVMLSKFRFALMYIEEQYGEQAAREVMEFVQIKPLES